VALEIHTAAFGEEIHTLATLNVGQMWDRHLGEFLNEWTRVSRQNLPAAEMESHMEAFMRNLSSNHEIDLARKSAGVAYNQGRNAETLTAKDEGLAEFAIRSAILDQATCGPCDLLDNEAFEIDSSEYFANLPPAQCLGGDRCRCFYVVVPGELDIDKAA